MKNKITTILNAADSSAEILLYGPIGDFWDEDISAREVADTLNLIKNVPNIKVRINSPGGEVSEGLAIYNSLLNHPAKINVEIDGWALSIASVIAMAGDSITMAESSLFIIHNPATIVMGNIDTLRIAMEMLEKARDVLLKAYQRHTNLSLKVLSQAMDAETWYTPKEAKAAGFITDIFEAQKVSANFNLDKYKFKNAPFKKGDDENKNKEEKKDVVLPDEPEFNSNEILLKKIEIELAEIGV